MELLDYLLFGRFRLLVFRLLPLHCALCLRQRIHLLFDQVNHSGV